MTHQGSHRNLSLDIASETRRIKGFSAIRWHIVDLGPGDGGPWVLTLQLYLTERAAYRFNLDAGTPRLFVLCGGSDGAPRPTTVTASQDVAAAWLDGEQQVLEVAMPMAIRAWLEAYLARHGEAPEEGRKKKRKGPGRAREQTA